MATGNNGVVLRWGVGILITVLIVIAGAIVNNDRLRASEDIRVEDKLTNMVDSTNDNVEQVKVVVNEIRVQQAVHFEILERLDQRG